MPTNSSLIKSNEKDFLLVPFSKKAPIYVLDVGYHETPPSHIFGPSMRPYYLLHLIESGKGEVERNGIVKQLSAGDAFLIYPGEITTYRSDEKEPWTYRWISFYGDFAKTLVENTTSKLYMTYHINGLHALKKALKYQIQDQIGSLNTLFTVLDSIKTQAVKASSDPVSIAMQYMQIHYFEPVKIAQLATEVGYSRAHFSTLFLKQTGDKPYAYLTKLRVQHATQLLLTSPRSIEEISILVGFASLQRFSESFKHYTGLSPMQYRKKFSQ